MLSNLGHVTLRHGHFVVIFGSRRSRGPSCKSMPNVKWIAPIVRNLLGGSKILNLVHLTRKSRPIWGHRMMSDVEGARPLYLCQI